MRILVISTWFPYPPICGAKIRKHNLIRQLARFTEVDLIALVQTLDQEQVEEGKQYLKNYCGNVHAISAIPYNAKATSTLQKIISPVPDVIRITRNAEFEERICEAWSRRNYDAAIATECGVTYISTFSSVSQKIRPLLVDSIEIGVLRPKSRLLSRQYIRQAMTFMKAKQFLSQLLRDVDIITVTSKSERALFNGVIPQKVPCFISPNVIDLNDYSDTYGPRDRRSIIHTGSFSYGVNYEAVLWFSQHVFWRIKAKDSLSFRITGKTAGSDLAPIRKACSQVEFTGLVKDIRPYIAQSRISIVPILTGGSTRLKILESMALGTPVVSTSRGAEGLEVTHEENILLADTPEDFAHQVDRLIEDDELCNRLSLRGQQLIKNKYTINRMGEQFEELLRGLIKKDGHTIKPCS